MMTPENRAVWDAAIEAAARIVDPAPNAKDGLWARNLRNKAKAIRALTPRDAEPCPCTLIEQDESCPVGFPSLLCDTCDGKGFLP